jgi:metallo-beta-lactamase class B
MSLKSAVARLIVATVLAAASGTAVLVGQRGGDTAESLMAAAKLAAGDDYPELYRLLCFGMRQPFIPPRPAEPPSPRPARQGPPPREEWHAEPVRVFDNLYYLGMTEYAVWAVTTSDGIILVDTIFDYSVEDEVIGGLKTLGLDPAQIKYAIVSHAHADHSGGAKYLQDRFKVRILMSAADWDLSERNTRDPSKPKRDMVVTDGQQLTLGDTTLTLHFTPGHTPGTLSTIIPVKDHGTPHVAALWGGTGFNFTLTPDKPMIFWFDTYLRSVQRFREQAVKAGADVILSNHTVHDGGKRKMPALAKRRPGDPHPYVVGGDGVARFLAVAEGCAKAAAGNIYILQ